MPTIDFCGIDNSQTSCSPTPTLLPFLYVGYDSASTMTFPSPHQLKSAELTNPVLSASQTSTSTVNANSLDNILDDPTTKKMIKDYAMWSLKNTRKNGGFDMLFNFICDKNGIQNVSKNVLRKKIGKMRKSIQKQMEQQNSPSIPKQLSELQPIEAIEKVNKKTPITLQRENVWQEMEVGKVPNEAESTQFDTDNEVVEATEAKIGADGEKEVDEGKEETLGKDGERMDEEEAVGRELILRQEAKNDGKAAKQKPFIQLGGIQMAKRSKPFTNKKESNIGWVKRLNVWAWPGIIKNNFRVRAL